MPLKSNLLAGDQRLQRCLVSDSAHVTLGDRGEYVKLIQAALILIDDLAIEQTEIDAGVYGRSTARAVLAYKERRKIISKSYQNSADDIVGKMTIQSLDDEMFELQKNPHPYEARICGHCGPPTFPVRDPKIRIGAKMKIADRFGRRV